MDRGNTDGSNSLLTSARKTFKEVGDQRGEAYALLVLSETVRRSGDREHALEEARAAMAAADAVGDLRAVAWSRLAVFQASNDAPDREDLRSALESLHSIGDVVGIHRCLMAAASVIEDDGNQDLATRVTAAAATLVPAELTEVEASTEAAGDPEVDIDSVVDLALVALSG